MNDAIKEKVRPVLSASVLVATAALGFSLAQSALGFLDDVRRELSSSSRCCTAFQTYRDEDIEQRRDWIKVIRAQGERIKELEIEVRVLQEVNKKAEADE